MAIALGVGDGVPTGVRLLTTLGVAVKTTVAVADGEDTMTLAVAEGNGVEVVVGACSSVGVTVVTVLPQPTVSAWIRSPSVSARVMTSMSRTAEATGRKAVNMTWATLTKPTGDVRLLLLKANNRVLPLAKSAGFVIGGEENSAAFPPRTEEITATSGSKVTANVYAPSALPPTSTVISLSNVRIPGGGSAGQPISTNGAAAAGVPMVTIATNKRKRERKSPWKRS